MNTYYFNDTNFKNTQIYRNFISEYPSVGKLKIRAYAASEAIPISNLQIIISTIYNDNNIIFFDGRTDSSGVIEEIQLPTPKQNTNNLEVPTRLTYDITAKNDIGTINKVYKVNMYENVCVVQTINIIPDMNMNGLDVSGS